jgi:epoxyqueuosine reductase QueG
MREEIEVLAKNLGADFIGIADLKFLKEYETYPENILEHYIRGIVIGIKVVEDVFDFFPSREFYATAYEIINRKLDEIAYTISKFIERKGYRALPIPASKNLQKLKWRSFISHKAIARASGIGWIGKSSLLITPQYGPRVRLASVLTNMPLEAGEPMKNKCGGCRKCVENCPPKAIKEMEFEDYPESRELVFDVDKCASETGKYLKDLDIGARVCGICIKVCPIGKN